MVVYFEYFVDLFLVFGDEDLCVVEFYEELKFFGNGVLVDVY